MSDFALLERDGTSAELRLNRPDQRNAMSIDLIAALRDRVSSLVDDPPTVLTITGEGRVFCAGMDLKEVLAGGDTPLRLLSTLGELTLEIRSLPSVVLAQVNGAAIGGGCGLACVCDLAATHADAKLGFPEVDLGLCPAVVAPWVVKKLGPGPARAVLLRGGVMTGQKAHRVRLVDELADSREALAEVGDAMRRELAAGAGVAIAATKGLLNELDGSLDADVVRDGAQLSASMVAQPETQRVLHERFGG